MVHCIHIEGLQVIISGKKNLSLMINFVLANEMPSYVAFHPGSSLFAKVLV